MTFQNIDQSNNNPPHLLPICNSLLKVFKIMEDPRDQRRMLDALKEIEVLKDTLELGTKVNAELVNELKRKDEEIQQLKEALKEIRKIAFEEFYTEHELLQSIKNKLIELNQPEK